MVPTDDGECGVKLGAPIELKPFHPRVRVVMLERPAEQVPGGANR